MLSIISDQGPTAFFINRKKVGKKNDEIHKQCSIEEICSFTEDYHTKNTMHIHTYKHILLITFCALIAPVVVIQIGENGKNRCKTQINKYKEC